MRELALPTAARRAPDLVPGGSYAKIVATATALPDTIRSNEEIVRAYAHTVSPSAIARITGVSQRRVVTEGVTDTDLLCAAVNQCLDVANLHSDDLTKILVTKFLGDRVLPMTASLLQKKLGCRIAVQGYDIDGGIHSFIHAVECAGNLMAVGDGPIVIASGGVINCTISRTDPRVAFQYGDGAAAVILAPTDRPHILATYSFCFPEFRDLATGFALRTTFAQSPSESPDHDRLFDLYSQGDWKRVHQIALDAMSRTRDSLLEAAGKRWAEVDFVLVTETQHRLWLAILDHLGIVEHGTISLLPRLGNTMSAMLPMQLDEAIRSGRVGPGSLVMMLSVGEGMTGGGVLVEL